MSAKNAIEWHTQIATDFDKKYANNKNFKERYAVWTQIIDRYSHRNLHTLDIGCGSGIFTFYLAAKNKTALGCDASTEMLKICQTKVINNKSKNARFFNCNIESLAQNVSQKADIVVCSSVLEYVDDLDSALDSITKLVNDEGVFLFSMPNKQSLYRKAEPLLFKLLGRPKYYKYIKNICTLKEIEKKLKITDFAILEKAYYGKTAFLSTIFRKLNIAHYSDNLVVIVAKRNNKK